MPTATCPHCHKRLNFSKYPSSSVSICPLCGREFAPEFPELRGDPDSGSRVLSPEEAARMIALGQLGSPPETAAAARIGRAARAVLFAPVTVILAASACVIAWVLTVWQPSTAAFLLNYFSLLAAGAILTAVAWRKSGGKLVPVSMACAAALTLLALNAWMDRSEKRGKTADGAPTVNTRGRFNPQWNEQHINYYGENGIRWARGPMSRSWRPHGRWTWQYADSAVSRWYWEGEEITEQEWNARNK